MLIQQVYGSEKTVLYSTFQRAEQLLPFYATHQESRDAFWLATKKRQAWRMIGNKHTFYFIAERTSEQWLIKNVLVAGDMPSWTLFFKEIEWCARFYFKKYCSFQLFEPLSTYWQTLLSHYGYTQDNRLAQTIWQKKLTYHIGLVLGGGGAHGAYQIGVWQTLKEHQIRFEVITGTSVGALNGVLILQDDLSQAFSLWQSLATNQVFQLPEIAVSEDLRKRFIEEIRQMTRTAIIKGGASITPLEKLLKSKLDAEKILKTESPRLFTVSTRLPDFKEVVTPIQQLATNEIADWILASASFYPAMSYRNIAGQKYIDGGYRNNLPVDVAIKEGATECLIVDVDGPGVTKKITVPEEIVSWVCRSNWSLGTFLIFDRQRNQFNLQLGYLEMKKKLGDFEGNWYTFYSTKLAGQYWRKFLSYLVNDLQLETTFVQQPKFWQILRNIYKDRVVIETCGVAMLELLAKKKLVLPNKVYDVNELIEQIIQKESSSFFDQMIREVGQLNSNEWRRVQKYQKKQKIEQEQINEIAHLVKQKKNEQLQSKLHTQLFDTLLNLYLLYLKEEQPWHKNFPTKS